MVDKDLFWNRKVYENMEQVELRVTYPTQSSLPFNINDEDKFGNHLVRGADYDAIQYMSQGINFKAVYVRNEDYAYGSLINKTTNEFNGIIGKIQKGVSICYSIMSLFLSTVYLKKIHL